MNRLGFSFTYYDENRKDEIIPVSVSKATGFDTYLTNAGSSRRSGVELSLNANPVKMDNFDMKVIFNYSKNNTIVTSLPEGLEQMEAPESRRNAFGFVKMVNKMDGSWGEIMGAGFKLDDYGNYVLNDDGTYVAEQGKYFGTVLPDYTGGVYTQFTFMKSIILSANVAYQKGGKFFSLTEFWGGYSGLLEETAEKNDKGNPVRNAVADGGGVHVVGVSESGEEIDTYVEAHDYFTQFYSNKLAEPFIHDASYIKLSDVSLSYRIPTGILSKTFISSITLGVVARNIMMISLAKDNVHGWDPSELAETYGENAQLPGVRSYGFNVKIGF
jgi:outer membrane receptor protein involved in Fe transport